MIESEILAYNIDEMKKNYKKVIDDIEIQANIIISEMEKYSDIPYSEINKDMHVKYEKKTKQKIDNLKEIVDKATEEYNNKRLMLNESRAKNPLAWEFIPNGEKLYQDLKPYYNSFNQKIISIQEKLELNLLEINKKIKMYIYENQFYDTIKKYRKSFDIKLLSSVKN